jgi:hypothetical protein
MNMPESARHQCMIYTGSPVVHVQGLARVIIEKLKTNQRCMYLNNIAMVGAMRSTLAAAGLDVGQEIERGSLVLSSKQDHLIKGRFNSDRMINMLTEAIDASLNDGFKGLWATGDMTWELAGEKSFEKLFAYECSLEVLFRRRPELSGICQYHHDTLPPDALRSALLTHRSTYINETLSRINPFYSQLEAPLPKRPTSQKVTKLVARAASC